MCLTWSKCNSTGAITGAISGFLLGIMTWLVTCQGYYGKVGVPALLRIYSPQNTDDLQLAAPELNGLPGSNQQPCTLPPSGAPGLRMRKVALAHAAVRACCNGITAPPGPLC